MAIDLSDQSILIVDDEQFSRSIVARLLEKMGKPQITEAGNGSEALDLLDNDGDKISLVIADFNMPVMHGLDLLKAIRAGEGGIGIDRGTPFAMLTGHSDTFLVQMALALDVNAFLIKPVSKKGLEQRLDKMLRHGTTGQWLKPATDYEAIDVKSALDNISIAPPGQDAPVSRGAIVNTADQPLFRAEKPSLARGALKGRPCSIKDIPAKAWLTRDVHTSNGQLVIAAGEDLTPRVITILDDLYDLGRLGETVWVAT